MMKLYGSKPNYADAWYCKGLLLQKESNFTKSGSIFEKLKIRRNEAQECFKKAHELGLNV